MNLPACSVPGGTDDASEIRERLANAIEERRQLTRMLATSLDELHRSIDQRHAGVDSFQSLKLLHAKLPSR